LARESGAGQADDRQNRDSFRGRCCGCRGELGARRLSRREPRDARRQAHFAQESDAPFGMLRSCHRPRFHASWHRAHRRIRRVSAGTAAGWHPVIFLDPAVCGKTAGQVPGICLVIM